MKLLQTPKLKNRQADVAKVHSYITIICETTVSVKASQKQPSVPKTFKE